MACAPRELPAEPMRHIPASSRWPPTRRWTPRGGGTPRHAPHTPPTRNAERTRRATTRRAHPKRRRDRAAASHGISPRRVPDTRGGPGRLAGGRHAVDRAHRTGTPRAAPRRGATTRACAREKTATRCADRLDLDDHGKTGHEGLAQKRGPRHSQLDDELIEVVALRRSHVELDELGERFPARIVDSLAWHGG